MGSWVVQVMKPSTWQAPSLLPEAKANPDPAHATPVVKVHKPDHRTWWGCGGCGGGALGGRGGALGGAVGARWGRAGDCGGGAVGPGGGALWGCAGAFGEREEEI